MRYWDSPKGKAKRERLAEATRFRRVSQDQPGRGGPGRGAIREYDEQKRLEFTEVCRAFNFCCASCGSHGLLTRDHVVPTKRFGSSEQSNIQPLCKRCNELKYLATTDYRLTAHPHCLAP